MTKPRLQVVAENIVSLSASDAASAQTLAAHLRAQNTWREVVPGLDSVCICFDPAKVSLHSVIAQLKSIENPIAKHASVTSKLLDIPVQYGGGTGPDLAAVCDALSLTEADFIARHTARTYPVEMIGFTPGFAYLGGLDEGLSVPRRAAPRTYVRAGSVGISGLYTGVYAMPGPGGWSLIGHTDQTLFDPASDEPFLILPGTQIRLVSV